MHRPSAEHGDDVDDGGVEVEQVGEGRAARPSAPAIDATAPITGNPAARKPPKTTTMTAKLTGRAMPSPRWPSILTCSMIRSTRVRSPPRWSPLGAGLLGEPVEDHVDLLGGGVLLLGGVVGRRR